ncbi:hypothetical protein I3F58_11465 [Streptomyces sp. MUM 203J]|uniref:hypothetical protein n=1 Tax=Streptomyces sp. MUM 203J TaxID=2791990 RepID=UPI001F032F9F|nr:hypothetical protein [Streptomyces sp. MUM 203J]MCH0540177.1 hypothetical protein [Streptomyces sp. MUM 203J]
MKRRVAMGAVVAALAGLVTAGGPALAEAGSEETAACATGPTVLETLPPAGTGRYGDDGVHALGRPGVAVGVSAGLPVYWTGTRVHEVPMPEGYDRGFLKDVNKRGTAVGRLSGPSGRALFGYRLGAPSVQLLSEGGAIGRGGGAAVNDAGYIAAVGADGTPRVWRKGAVVRELPLPADAGSGTSVRGIAGINARGDVLGHAVRTEDADEGFVYGENPVVWPGDGGPAKSLPVAVSEWLAHNTPTGIDSEGRVVGTFSATDRFNPVEKPWHWAVPYEDTGSSPGLLRGFGQGGFSAISPTTNVSVGTARSYGEEVPWTPSRAQYWPGRGPLLALPGLAPGRDSEAWAVSDDDRVGGVASPESWGFQPVIWHCAGKQAYRP